MQALVFRGKHQVALENSVPLPILLNATDAIVRISLCGLCGSDMHPYHCREQGLDLGTVCGHEFVGIVTEVGAWVENIKQGDHVMSPFTASCGACFFCLRGLTARCKHAGLFGWVEGGKGFHGAQAQFIRVPMADSTLVKVPDDVSEEEALLLGDVFSTGFFCADNAGIKQYSSITGDPPVVAVVGCGPVGLMAVIGAKELGAETVFAIDSIPERLQLAEKFGATVVDRSSCDAVQTIRDCTGGRGADVVLEAVGFPPAFQLAVDIVRLGGTISSCGCHSEATVPLVTLYNKNLTLKSGRCSARAYMERLVPLVQSKKYDITAIITHRLPLVSDAYELFDSKRDGCIKLVMRPHDNVPLQE